MAGGIGVTGAQHSARELLAWANAAMAEPDSLPAGVWPHAAALLARDALEQALDEMWRDKAPGLENRPAGFQILCLPSYLDDSELAGRASLVWSNLTHASHHHPYDLAPTAVELREWLTTVTEVVEALDRMRA